MEDGGAAARLRLVATQAAEPLARRVGAELGLAPLLLETRRFANENLECSAAGLDLEERDVVLLQRFPPPLHDHLLELLFGLQALRAAGPRSLTALLPYLPYGRSDRPAWRGAPVPARLVAELIERAGADRLVTVDLHSPQVAGFFGIPVLQARAREALLDAVRGWSLPAPVVVSPDLGGAKRAAEFADALGAPLALLRKERRGTEVETLGLLGEVQGRAVLLVDDEIATGGTIVAAVADLRARGATSLSVAATHPVLAGDALQRLARAGVERIAVADTLPLPEAARGRLDVVSIAPALAAVLRERPGEPAARASG